MNRNFLFLTAAILLLLFVWAFPGSHGAISLAAEESSPAPTAVKPPDPNLVVAAGRVEAISENLDIGTPMDGRLAQVPVEEGQSIRRGQILAVLDNADFAARVRLAEAQILEREAELQRLKNGSRPEARREAGAQVREAEVALEHARQELDRRRSILARGAISRSEFDQADREYRMAEARLDALRQRQALINDETRQEDVLRVEAEIKRAQAQRLEAQALLAKTIIRSPIDGAVLRRHKQAGESVSTSLRDPILVIGDTSRLRVRVDVDESDVARVALGQRVEVKAEAYGSLAFTGKVVRLGTLMGRKRVMTNEPTERVDRKVLETIVDLDPGQRLPLGLRVDTYIHTR
jgi:HlyD family secretion protein